MKYLYLKLGRGNSLARYWLQLGSERNIFRRSVAVIFFGKTTTDLCRELIGMLANVQDKEKLKTRCKRSRDQKEKFPSYTDVRNQIKPFIEAGDTKKAKFVTIVGNEVYVYEPDGTVFDMPPKKYDDYNSYLKKLRIKDEYVKADPEKRLPKVMHVKNVKPCKESPHVLTTLPCNQYFTRGTCREISYEKHWGTYQAINKCSGQAVERPKNANQWISLLGWHQFETLVFLILLNAGVFPSAWRAGTLPNIDIEAKNYENCEIKIGNNPQVVFKPNKKKTFQIKRGAIREPSAEADYTVAIDFHGKKDERILTSKWLLEQIKAQPKTRDWFEKSLEWTSLKLPD